MGKVQIIQAEQSKILDIKNVGKTQVALDGDKINRIKDGYYRVMDGLHELEDLLKEKEVSNDKKLIDKALTIMKGVELERFWMRSK